MKTSKVVGRSFLFPSGRTNKISVLLSSPPVHPAALQYVPPTLRYQTSWVYFFSSPFPPVLVNLRILDPGQTNVLPPDTDDFQPKQIVLTALSCSRAIGRSANLCERAIKHWTKWAARVSPRTYRFPRLFPPKTWTQVNIKDSNSRKQFPARIDVQTHERGGGKKKLLNQFGVLPRITWRLFVGADGDCKSW